MKKFKEWISIQVEKQPSKMVLLIILFFNILFFVFAAFLISYLSSINNVSISFFEAIYYTITMIMDAGCISYVVEDLGQTGLAIVVTCLCVIFVGVISFTGAVIGYVTNAISNFIDNANSGSRKLNIYDHIVILNWNSRASEIINDLLYCKNKEKVVVLVKDNKEEIEREIEERLTDTINTENAKGNRFAKNISDKITLIIRKGDVFSSKQLHDIALEKAKSIIILGDDSDNQSDSGFNTGNAQTIKTLMQVSDIVSAESSLDDQKVIVEVSDQWTWDVVSKIIDYKMVRGKCNIQPIRVNKVLGQLLSQFSVMPELNEVYKELLSNKGMSFYPVPVDNIDETDYFREYLKTHSCAIPLAVIDYNGRLNAYFACRDEADIHDKTDILPGEFKVDVNHDFKMEEKNVVIIGHNSNIHDIMDGFMNFRCEWNASNGKDEIIKILIIDDKESIERMNYYKNYPFVVDTIEASVYDRDLICSSIIDFSQKNEGDTSILVLSDDAAPSEEIDNVALANLVYIQDIIQQKKKENPDFNEKSLDPIIEIINPKHHDVVNNYNANNVVISNRYISKMVLQLGEKDALFDFFKDILTYDTDCDSVYESREIYLKRADRFFNKLPGKCNARDLVNAVYNDSVDYKEKSGSFNPCVILGYISFDEKMVLFSGDMTLIEVELKPDDLLVVYCAH